MSDSIKIYVKVKPWAKREEVKKLLQGYEVSVAQPAQDGKANKRAVELLAEYFNVAKSDVRIKSGSTGRYKIFEISGS